jgi:hypothetical protein
MKKLSILVVATLILVGCSMVDRQMESWIDHHQSELIANWGPPQQIMDDSQGGKIFIYSATRNHTTQGRATTNVTGSAYSVGDFTYGNATGHTTYTPPQTSSYNAYRMFWINSNGYIYRAAWRGL